MATVSWQNADGLGVSLGTNEATQRQGGEYRTSGPLRFTEIVLPDLTVLTSTAGGTILDNLIVLPKNARIEEVEVEVYTAATSGGSATIDIGLVRLDRSTELDFNGLVAAATVASVNTAGKRLNLINGSTSAGALIGTTTANPSMFVANYTTAAFTAGALRVRVKWVGV